MPEITFDAHELDRIDLFATQQLLKIVATRLLDQSAEPDAQREAWAQDLEFLVRGFDFQNADPEKAEVAREHMLNVALELLSQCRMRPASDGPR